MADCPRPMRKSFSASGTLHKYLPGDPQGEIASFVHRTAATKKVTQGLASTTYGRFLQPELGEVRLAASPPRRARHSCMRLQQDAAPRQPRPAAASPRRRQSAPAEARPQTSPPQMALMASPAAYSKEARKGRVVLSQSLPPSPLSKALAASPKARKPAKLLLAPTAQLVALPPQDGSAGPGRAAGLEASAGVARAPFDSDGSAVAEVFASCNIALVKVGHLRALARQGKRLPRCQDLLLKEQNGPQGLQTSVVVRGEELKRQLRSVEVYVVSHAWLAIEHPDPLGSRLEELVEELDYLRAKNSDLAFIDYCSLPQIDKTNVEYRRAARRGEVLGANHAAMRSPEQEKDLQAAIAQMDVIYGSGIVKVVVLPSIHNVDEMDKSIFTRNERRYRRRGWCCLEFAVAQTFNRIVNEMPKELEGFDPSPLEELVEGGEVKFLCIEDKAKVLKLFRRTYYTAKQAVLIEVIEKGKAELCREGIETALHSLRPTVRQRVAKALGDARCSGFVVEVWPLLEDADYRVRVETCKAITRMRPGDPKVTQAVMELLQDSHPAVRGAACISLAELGSEGSRHKDAIAARLADEDWEVRETAVKALGSMGNAILEYSAALAACLGDRMPFPRVAALSALFKIGPPGEAHAEKVMELAKLDPLNFVRSAALATLRRMGREDLVREALGPVEEPMDTSF